MARWSAVRPRSKHSSRVAICASSLVQRPAASASWRGTPHAPASASSVHHVGVATSSSTRSGPGDDATAEDAAESVAQAQAIITAVQGLLGQVGLF
jgi:hypothetical protein